MTSFNPGDTVVISTWCGAELATLVDASDHGVMLRASDGHVDYWPADASNSTGDLLGRLRHATDAEVRLYDR